MDTTTTPKIGPGMHYLSASLAEPGDTVTLGYGTLNVTTYTVLSMVPMIRPDLGARWYVAMLQHPDGHVIEKRFEADCGYPFQRAGRPAETVRAHEVFGPLMRLVKVECGRCGLLADPAEPCPECGFCPTDPAGSEADHPERTPDGP